MVVPDIAPPFITAASKYSPAASLNVILFAVNSAIFAEVIAASAISAVPIVTRNDISNDFSVEKYATGVLLQGSVRSGRGGIW